VEKMSIHMIHTIHVTDRSIRMPAPSPDTRTDRAYRISSSGQGLAAFAVLVMSALRDKKTRVVQSWRRQGKGQHGKTYALLGKP
jgi:hypothetical protein